MCRVHWTVKIPSNIGKEEELWHKPGENRPAEQSQLTVLAVTQAAGTESCNYFLPATLAFLEVLGQDRGQLWGTW